MRSISGFTLAAALALGGAAYAQEAEDDAAQTEAEARSETLNNASFGDWRVVCEAVSTTRTACRIVQSQRIAESGDLVAQFVAYPLSEGAALFVAQVPIGVYLPGGAVYRPAEDEAAEQTQMIWQRCAGPICEAALQLSAEDVAGFAETGALVFGYQMDPGADPIITRVDVSTFAEALEAVRQE